MSVSPQPSATPAPPANVPSAGSTSAIASGWSFDYGFFGVALGLVVLVGLVSWLYLPPHRQTPGNHAPDGAAAAVATIGGRHRQLIDFSLTERSGRTVTRHDLDGQILVVSFVFTGCSLNCRRVNDRMEQIQQRVLGVPGVRLLSFTVDPQSDSPSALGKFAASYHADTDRWWFLTGDKTAVYRVIETCFLSRSTELAGIIPGGFGQIDHILLLDAAGTVRGSFNGTSERAADEILASITRLRAEAKPL